MPRLTIIGDVNVEVMGQADVPFREISENRLLYRHLEMTIGGTAAKFAVAAMEIFDPVCVVGSVGADELGTWAERWLVNLGIDARLRHEPSLPTGLAVSVRDGSEDGGVRLLLVNAENANHALGPGDIDRNADCLTQADLVLTDGYCLLKESRRKSTLDAMRRASEAAVTVVVDIVPHDCYRLIGGAELAEWLAYANVCIVEVLTIRRLLRMEPAASFADLPLAWQTADALAVKFPRHAFLLRFGIQNVEQSLVCRPGHNPLHRFTGVVGAPRPHVLADQVTARELREFFIG